VQALLLGIEAGMGPLLTELGVRIHYPLFSFESDDLAEIIFQNTITTFDLFNFLGQNLRTLGQPLLGEKYVTLKFHQLV
jgi:hypothetical protein